MKTIKQIPAFFRDGKGILLVYAIIASVVAFQSVAQIVLMEMFVSDQRVTLLHRLFAYITTGFLIISLITAYKYRKDYSRYQIFIYTGCIYLVATLVPPIAHFVEKRILLLDMLSGLPFFPVVLIVGGELNKKVKCDQRDTR